MGVTGKLGAPTLCKDQFINLREYRESFHYWLTSQPATKARSQALLGLPRVCRAHMGRRLLPAQAIHRPAHTTKAFPNRLLTHFTEGPPRGMAVAKTGSSGGKIFHKVKWTPGQIQAAR